MSQQAAHGSKIAQAGNVGESKRLVGQYGSGHKGQGGVFGSADSDRAGESGAAFDFKFVHACILLLSSLEKDLYEYNLIFLFFCIFCFFVLLRRRFFLYPSSKLETVALGDKRSTEKGSTGKELMKKNAS
jgi:hypothetical protein